MKKFELYEDVKVQSWRRYFYTIEAETLEEALQQVIDGDADCDDSEELYDVDYFMNPYDNNGEATQEIYNRDDDELLHTNAIFLIGVDTKKSKKEPWRTGEIAAIKDSCSLALKIKPNTATLKDGTTYCFIDQNLGKELGLWE